MSYIGNQITGFLGTGSLTVTTSTVAVEGDSLFSADGNVVIGDASGDTITINAATASIPNNLNIDSNTLFLNASNNRVGIGNASPATALDVTGTVTSDGLRVDGEIAVNTAIKSWDASTDAVQFQSGSLWNFSTSQLNLDQNVYYNGAYKYLNTGAASEYSQASGAHFFKVASSGSADADISFTTALTVANSANVGIGTNSPNYDLTVGMAGTTANSYIQLASTTTGTGNLFFGDTTGTGAGSYSGYVQYNHNTDDMILATNSTPALTIDSSQNVGIGTSSPTSRLSIFGSGGVPFRWGDTTALGTLTYSGSDPIIQSNTGNTLFYQGSSEAMRIDSSGNLLVGKTSSDLTTDGFEVRPTGFVGVRTNGDPLYLNRKSTDGAIATFAKDGSTVGSIGTGSNLLTIGTGTGNLLFADALVAPAGSSSAGNSSGVVDLGSSGRRFKDFHLNGGIYFGSRSNALNDYEEGSWTVSVEFSNTGCASNTTRARYVKIGTMVHVSATFGITGTPTSGTLEIGGLPFTPSGNVETTGSVMLNNAGFNANTVNLCTYLYNVANKANIYATRDGAGWYPLTNTMVSTGDSIIFSLTYYTG